VANELFGVVHEDADLLIVNKPAGLVCHPTKSGPFSSLIGRVRVYLGEQGKPHLVNRLDRETSGLVVVAKNPETAGELGKLVESGGAKKEYLAIVHGHAANEHQLIDAPLGKDEQSRVAIKDCVRPDGATAQTEVWLQQKFTRVEGDFSLLRIAPRTGRKHQIRIHLAHIGHPIVGDKLYGGDEDLYLALVEDRLTEEQRRRLILPHHALHAAQLAFEWRGERKEFRAEPEKWFQEFTQSAAEL